MYLGADVNVDRWDWGHDLDDTKFSFGLEAGYAFFLTRTVTIEPAAPLRPCQLEFMHRYSDRGPRPSDPGRIPAAGQGEGSRGSWVLNRGRRGHQCQPLMNP